MNTATAVPKITMQAVQSSQISAIGHCAETNTLAIQFASKKGPGSIYHYQNFTPELFAAFAAAESIGSHFGKHIKPAGDKFPFAKIEPPAPAAITSVPPELVDAADTLEDHLHLLNTLGGNTGFSVEWLIDRLEQIDFAAARAALAVPA